MKRSTSEAAERDDAGLRKAAGVVSDAGGRRGQYRTGAAQFLRAGDHVHSCGELAMQELKNIDEVAYVRFASVYRQFGDINTFMDELKDLLNKRATQGRDTASEDAEK